MLVMTVSNRKELERLKRDRALITVYLDNVYSRETVRCVMRAKPGFDANVREAWHMLMPYEDASFAVDAPLSARNYGVDLARQIIDENGIPNRDLPVILFENNSDEGDLYYISLADMTDKEVLTTMGGIADIVMHHYINGRDDPKEYREDIVDEVKRTERKKGIVHFIKRNWEKPLGLLGLLGV